MKVKALSRSSNDYLRERSQDIHKIQRNLDPSVHPFEQGREYIRALNSTKLERLFAKPFVGALSGHIDGVYSMVKHPSRLNSIISGSGDGEIRIWELSEQRTTWTTRGHTGIVNGVCAGSGESQFLSCSSDKTVKIWNASESTEALETYIGRYAFTGLSHHRSDPVFATSGNTVDVWDEHRSEPIHEFAWGADSYQTVKFNQVETNILASCGTDRTIVLYDLRTNKPLSKLVMSMRTNAIAWNPIEAFTFAAANEDHNAYIFDMRRMESAKNVLKDHVSAVMDIDYSPTGQEVVTGSYDRTLRVYNVHKGHSRDVYHTKRMQRIFSVQFSMDSKYVLSGSDDGNIRIWKAHASEKMGVKDWREKNHLEYSQKLKERFSHMDEIRRIDRHRRIPGDIKRADKTKKEMLAAQKRKDDNRRKHSKKAAEEERVSERKKAIIGVAK
ncbi:WD40-repeat-containing domain protein [Radiomyces spectabilis]|uniref:WD40-repeat-containing domain protein n=1 Tax=Radiomyces spectabilis TaxID=64574 RepID=UPI00221EF988|nr:WD40-repeat-containing domain protein [Radiomyces spectabilis]KAI8376464.1 WD40-repeat-containing domain protein [Radiomyces spectabilis]